MSLFRAPAVAAVCVAALAAATRAAETQFLIDSTTSTLSFSGGIFWNLGDPLMFAPQGPGSLNVNVGGTILADVAPGSIDFLGGALTLGNSGIWLPGSTPANFGFAADSGQPEAIGAMTGAMRAAVFTLDSPAMATTPGGDGFSFPADALTYTGVNGELDFDGTPAGSVLGALAGVTESLAGRLQTGAVTPVPTAEYDALTETLTLPVSVVFENFPQDIAFLLTGTIVATVGIPEPASGLLLAGLSLAALRPTRLPRGAARRPSASPPR